MDKLTKFKFILGLVLIAIPVILIIMWYVESVISSNIKEEAVLTSNGRLLANWACMHVESYSNVAVLLGLFGVAGAILVALTKSSK